MKPGRLRDVPFEIVLIVATVVICVLAASQRLAH